jgi:hypothetical protein
VRCSNGASVARRQRSNPEWPSSGGPDTDCYVQTGPQFHRGVTENRLTAPS